MLHDERDCIARRRSSEEFLVSSIINLELYSRYRKRSINSGVVLQCEEKVCGKCQGKPQSVLQRNRVYLLRSFPDQLSRSSRRITLAVRHCRRRRRLRHRVRRVSITTRRVKTVMTALVEAELAVLLLLPVRQIPRA